MKRSIALAVAALATVGSSLVILPNFAADDANMVRPASESLQPNQPLAFPFGIAEKKLNAEGSIRSALADTTEAALTKKNAVNEVAGYFVNADRDRIRAEVKNMNTDTLDNRVTELSNAYKNKYGKAFNVDASKVFIDQFIELRTGEITDPDALTGHWPIPQTLGSTIDKPVNDATGMTTGASVAQNEKFFGGSTKLDKGRNVAIVRIGMSHKMPQLTLSLIHELPNSWRLDVPDNVSGQNIYDRLLDGVTYLNGHQELWPADKYEADRMISHCLLGAVYGQFTNPDTKTASDR
jgi:hypothetical protein